MAERYLVTHTLLYSWQYLLKENPYEDATTESDPMGDFLRLLRREPTPTTEAMQNGIDFENLVTHILHNRGDRSDKWWDAAAQIARELTGAQLQVKVSKEIEVGIYNVVLYGRLDALKAGEITDIKFTKGYERGKYYDSTQHPAYFELVPEADRFTYAVSNGADVWHETYYREDTADIRTIISRFFDWLHVNGLWELYAAHWSAK